MFKVPLIFFTQLTIKLPQSKSIFPLERRCILILSIEIYVKESQNRWILLQASLRSSSEVA